MAPLRLPFLRQILVWIDYCDCRPDPKSSALHTEQCHLGESLKELNSARVETEVEVQNELTDPEAEVGDQEEASCSQTEQFREGMPFAGIACSRLLLAEGGIRGDWRLGWVETRTRQLLTASWLSAGFRGRKEGRHTS